MPTETRVREEDLAWLVELEHKQRSFEKEASFPGRPRTLTSRELKRILEIIAGYGLICEMTHNGYGPMMQVYAPPPAPNLAPTAILAVTYEQLPCNRRKINGPDAWRNGWEAFSPVTHSARNRVLLSRYGFEEPRGYGAYIC